MPLESSILCTNNEKTLTLYKGKLSFRDEASTYFLVIFFSWKAVELLHTIVTVGQMLIINFMLVIYL